jgi:hypothetical protein
MDKIIPMYEQEKIQALTGAKLVEDLNLQRIYIGAASEESRDRAIHKLDNIRKYFVCPSILQ